MEGLLHYVTHRLLDPIARVLLPGDPFSVLSLVAAILFAAGYFLWRRRRNRSTPIRSLVRYLFPRRVWQHSSTKLDIRLFAVNIVLWGLIYGAAIVTSTFWRDVAVDGLSVAFGPAEVRNFAVWPIVALTTVAVFLAADLGYWLAHWAHHNVPAIWEIHKVHHSAEVMTPFTEWRQNPFEDIVFSNVMALTAGGTYGAILYLCGPATKQVTLLDVNILMLAYYLTLHHLRHSHVWLPLRGVLGHVIHSPAHHQIHHSSNPRHQNKNLGIFLVFWDWVFGTLYVPEKNERLTLGLGKGAEQFNTVREVYVRPFVRAGRLLFGRRRIKAAPAP